MTTRTDLETALAGGEAYTPGEAPTTNGTHSTEDESVLFRLARLSPISYDRVRAAEAEKLGIRVSTLDDQVGHLRAASLAAADTSCPLVDVEPWPDCVHGAGLLRDLADRLRRHVVMSDHALVAATLWIVHTQAIDVADVTPILGIVSPTKRCGKTTLLELLSRLVARPLPASNISQAAVYRTIEAWRPTLLIDEADTALPGHDELRGILNSGHSRGTAYVIRTEARQDGGYQPAIYSTWGAKAIAQIGRLPPTLHDRAVDIQLARRLPSDSIVRLRDTSPAVFTCLARRCRRWAADHMEALRDHRPDIPRSLNDRASDNWTILLAIADLAGGDWPVKARNAAIALSGTDDSDADDLRGRLLGDLAPILAGRGCRISSASIITALVTIEDGPWGDMRGRPLSARRLADLLRPYGVVSSSDGTIRGYRVVDLEAVVDRYLPWTGEEVEI